MRRILRLRLWVKIIGIQTNVLYITNKTKLNKREKIKYVILENNLLSDSIFILSEKLYINEGSYKISFGINSYD